MKGPGWSPTGIWYRGVRYREEHARRLPDTEDLWCAGTFTAELSPGEAITVEAWAGAPGQVPPPAGHLVSTARSRARQMAQRCRPLDETDEHLAIAADQMIIEGPAVVAGYPWFGEWSRDTLTSYEGLFLETHRYGEGRALLERHLALLDQGMLPNTADTGVAEYNTADATLWLLHALGRHVEVTGDTDLVAAAMPHLDQVIAYHLAGTRHHIRADPSDGLLTQGAEGLALTWMDARIDGQPVTPRAGKAVEINALWASGLATLAMMQRRAGHPDARAAELAASARASFIRRFRNGPGLLDVVDGDPASAGCIRPNQLLAVSLPHGPLRDRPEATAVVAVARSHLLTPLGLRSLSPVDSCYRPYHRGGPADRDLAYHQGTVWPWLIGPYVDACLAVGTSAEGVLGGLSAHLPDRGIGSVSETADGAAPHRATGCPFQAWSVAELLRARRAQCRAS